MNTKEEQLIYRDALENGLLNGSRCYKKVDAAIRETEQAEALQKMPRRRALRIAVLAAALLLAGCAVAVAAGILLTGSGSRIGFFSDTDSSAIRAQQDYYERHSDALRDEVLDEHGNKILTVENIAIHKDTISIFCSLENKRDQPSITLSINGGDERQPVRSERTDVGNGQSVMTSFLVFPSVPESCTMTVRFTDADGTLLSVKGYTVDLTQNRDDSVLILSGKTVQIKGEYSEEPTEPPYRPYHDHTVTIESIRIDRDGGCITLTEPILPQGPYTNEAYAAWAEARTAAKEAYFREHPGSTDLEWEQNGQNVFLQENPCPLTHEEIMALYSAYDEENPVSWDPFINFSVTDENGNSLMPQLEYYTGSSGQGLAVNEILFTPREGMKAIRLTPLYYAGRTETVRAMFDSEPSEGGKLELTSFSVDKQKRIVTVSYRVSGVRILDSFGDFLLNREGEPVFPNTEQSETRFMDAASGIVTTQFRILDPDWDMDQIGGYGQEWSVPYPDEEKTVTIYLER